MLNTPRIFYNIVIICSLFFLTITVLIIPPSNHQQNPAALSILGARAIVNQQRIVPPVVIEPTIQPPIRPPVFSGNEPPPAISAEAGVVIDRTSYSTLFEQNSTVRIAPASTTKIVTAIIAIENYPLDDVVTIPADIQSIPGSSMHLKPGDQLLVEDLLWGMLINSGNDAAHVLATLHTQGSEGFINAMNQLVTRLNLFNTHFVNPTGFDFTRQYTTAHDLAIITDFALQFPIFREIVSTTEKSITAINNPASVYKLINTNQLLQTVPDVYGVKTGWTTFAQGVLVTYVNRAQQPTIIVVMRSGQREADTQRLIDWVYTNYRWE